MKIFAIALIGAAAVYSSSVYAHDKGQHEGLDPVVKSWYEKLMQPDNPTMSCCGEADAYWADKIEYRNGKVYATVTDDRDDKPLKRAHIPNGTVVEIPKSKLKWDNGNPTGHAIVFMTGVGYVMCFVQGTGI
jgi:hypothetical protein